MARCKPKRSASVHKTVARKKRAKRPTAKRPHAHKRTGGARPTGSGHVGTGSRCLGQGEHRGAHGRFASGQ